VVCADELGPVIPRSFPPAPAWTPDGHRVKALLDYGRGPEKTWVYGALRPVDGHTVTLTAPARNSAGYQRLLATVEAANPTVDLIVITDNLSSHNSHSTRTWLLDHPRIRQVFIPKRACWLNLQEAWRRLFRRQALAGQSFATPRRSPWPPGWRPAGSTPAPARGCGAAHHRPHATDATPSPTGFSERSTNSTPLGGCGCWLPPADRLGESAQAQGARAGPTGKQQLQLAHDREGGQADARTFGSSRSKVTKACATDTRVTWWCQPRQERPSK
jgi:DDE superfamily endonuclease